MILKEVTGASRYSFNDRDTGRLVEGVNVFFMQTASTADQVGKIPQKVSLPISAWDKVKAIPFPIDCEAVIEQQFTSRGIKSKVVDIDCDFTKRK